MAAQKFAVTTSLRPAPEQVETARLVAGELKVPYVERGRLSLEVLSAKHGLGGMVVVSAQRISYISGDREFYFHPGLARLRIMELKNGKTDQMIKAMSLRRGDSVLDCTLGLGADAIVASYVSGAEGRVTGVESSPLIALLVRRGLAACREVDQDIAPAMRRVEVINANYKDYLAGLPPRSFDVVYFDPMFRIPLYHSPAMNAMRTLANPEPVDRETIDLAVTVGVKRVVFKERRGSSEFQRLGFKLIVGGKHAPVSYGVIDLQGASDEG
ncbi:MAG: class I SAM-dependent methyltransferase [Peptococcaceae bacterium]|nr:class I SAM-dependent methyltransferase [Peptococcaceae bacterium]